MLSNLSFKRIAQTLASLFLIIWLGLTFSIQTAFSQATSSKVDHERSGGQSIIPDALAEDEKKSFYQIELIYQDATDIKLDGLLTESHWQKASEASGLTQHRPFPGEPSPQQSTFKLFRDHNTLYVGVLAFDTAPDSISAPLFRRDSNQPTDWVFVAFDSYNDKRTAFVFAVNPSGVQADMKISNNSSEDWLWDAVWNSGVSRFDGGWSAEFAIPMSQLRFIDQQGDENATWGVNFGRDILRFGEVSFWAPTLPEEVGVVSQFGTLTGVGVLEPPKGVEVLPYVSQGITRAPEQVGNPFYQRNDPLTNLGADLRYKFKNGLTASATLNPDFGQVEADPTQINLSDNQLFFPEKRPFFIEGSDIFQFGRTKTFSSSGPPITFYSRRIGRSPQGSPALAGNSVAFQDIPLQTSILAATKISGKVAGDWSIGVLHAITAEETAPYQPLGGTEKSVVVEPITHYVVSRFKKDLFDGRGFVGGFNSYVNRSIEGTYFEEFLSRQSWILGTDFEWASLSRDWIVSGTISATQVDGSSDFLERLQRSSVRYYQRPDYRTQSIQSNLTSLSGTAGEFSIQKSGGQHWIGSLTYSAVSPGYETNDAGFQNQAGYRSIRQVAAYVERNAQRVQSYDIFAFQGYGWNPDGDLVNKGFGFGSSAVLKNLWKVRGELSFSGGMINDRMTRGGPAGYMPAMVDLELGIQTDASKVLSGGFNGRFREDVTGEFDIVLGFSAAWQPKTNLRLTFAPEVVLQMDNDQYITARTDPWATATYGTRYIFSDIDQTLFGAAIRANWTFSPRLSLETFLRPYFVTGDYYNFKQFTTPREFEFDLFEQVGVLPDDQQGRIGSIRYEEGMYRLDPDASGPAPEIAFQNPDFSFASLQGNAIVRWEYRPGSTFYFVWQHQKSDYLNQVETSLFDRSSDLLNVQPTNIFMVKVSYWLGT